MTIAWAALSVGCLSRWSGCRTYDTGHIEGAGWKARVVCEPHTNVNLRSAGPVLQGCDAQWSLVIERDRRSTPAPLNGPYAPSHDCGAVRNFCKTSHGELASRATSIGTWIAGRPPTGGTRVAFVSSTCNATFVLPPDVAASRTPTDAVNGQPDGLVFLDGVIAHARITDGAWPLVCGAALTQRVAAVRAAMLECRVPDTVAEELFQRDEASVDAAWSALTVGRFPCDDAVREVFLRGAPGRAGALALQSLARCERSCTVDEREEALYVAGRLHLATARDATQRVASAGPPSPLSEGASESEASRYAGDYGVWLRALWALTRIDPHAGVEVGLTTLRRIPVSEGSTTMPQRSDALPHSGGDDAAADICSILASSNSTETRDALWQLASDESASVGARQRALLTLARLGDARASGQGLAHNPLTVEQATVVADALSPSRSGGGSGGSGHSHHHWH